MSGVADLGQLAETDPATLSDDDLDALERDAVDACDYHSVTDAFKNARAGRHPETQIGVAVAREPFAIGHEPVPRGSIMAGRVTAKAMYYSWDEYETIVAGDDVPGDVPFVHVVDPEAGLDDYPVVRGRYLGRPDEVVIVPHLTIPLAGGVT